MRATAKVFLAVLVGVMFFAGGETAYAANTINIPEAAGGVVFEDDDDPEVTARVARVSFIRGEAKIRRSGGGEWEKLALNLPLVEGDEIVTDAGSRVEIQLDKDQHLRLDENAYLKLVSLKDNGIAVSLSLGSMTIRLTAFDKDKQHFEIDAPKTTLAVQRKGSYRIDAGREKNSEIRVAATEGGELRVYSESAGFTVKNNRNALIYIDGPSAGEWQVAEASVFDDEFDTWSLERDAVIAKRLRDAHYDRYYDRDIYGADDLNEHGSWVHTRDYGYIWRPHPAAIGVYADWSPYRYGHWRWVPPYGWTWINDEPWGWAAYHHGRWIHHNGNWHWSPYGHYRHRRSWWQPALVVINIIANNVCWYPTPYYRRPHDYNSGNRRRRDRNPGPGPAAVPQIPARETAGILGRVKGPRSGTDVPPGGIVAIGRGDFGRKTGGNQTAPPSVAKTILAKPNENKGDLDLPDYKGLGRRINPDFGAERPRIDPAAAQARVGAAKRNSAAPLDDELRSTRIFGGRPPRGTDVDPSNSPPRTEPRNTGAFERKPPTRGADAPPRIILSPKDSPGREAGDGGDQPREIRRTPKESPRYEPPTESEQPRKQPQRDIRPSPRESPRYEPPTERIEPRKEPQREIRPSPKESPRHEPPSREQPRDNPPPARQPAPKSDPPPQKSEPKPDKPAPPAKKQSPIID